MITVLTPTFGRARKLPAVVANIHQATKTGAQVILILEADDHESIAMGHALRETAETVINDRTRSWSGAINCGYQHAKGEHIFTGSDDLHFHEAWDLPALQLLKINPELRVSGTNDLGSPTVMQGLASTSSLVDRRYIDEIGGVIDQGPGIVQYEGYDHNYTDTEFVDTAKFRGVFAPCLDSWVEHMHPNFGKNAWDDTYGLSTRFYQQDGEVFAARKHMWTVSA